MNGIPLQNVDYATAIQVLRDSGDTVALVVKRRTPPMSNPPFYNHNHHPYQVQQHQLPVQPLYHHNHNHSASSMPFTYSPPAFTPPVKVTLTKNSKKEGNFFNNIAHFDTILSINQTNNEITIFFLFSCFFFIQKLFSQSNLIYQYTVKKYLTLNLGDKLKFY